MLYCPKCRLEFRKGEKCPKCNTKLLPSIYPKATDRRMSLRSRTTLLLLPLLVILLLMGISAGCQSPSPEPPTIAPRPAWPSQTPEGDSVKGWPDAPVTIIEYTEYECPFCGRFVQETLPLIEENYIATGKVRLIFRNFPVHQHSLVAAGAAVCAQEQDKFWQMHDTLFAQKAEWSGNPDFIQVFKGYAQDMGLDVEQFTSCLDAGEWSDKVQRDFEMGLEAEVPGTPSFLINDQMIIGAHPFREFQRVIEEELSE